MKKKSTLTSKSRRGATKAVSASNQPRTSPAAVSDNARRNTYTYNRPAGLHVQRLVGHKD